jgi:hypothetical protein
VTHEEFQKLPFLLEYPEVLEVMDYAPRTLEKMVECAVLVEVMPAGITRRRFRKVQIAMMAGLEWQSQAEEFKKEPLLMREKAVVRWTGYAQNTLRRIVRAHGVTIVRPAGMTAGKFRKLEIAELLGLQKYV